MEKERALLEENEDLKMRIAALEDETEKMANLLVAGRRLHGFLDRQGVVAAIQEILINLIGSEETALFELENGELRLLASMGIAAERYRRVSLDAGVIGEVARTATSFIGDDDPRRVPEPDLSVCIPLRLGARVIGAIAVFRLLPQKTRLEPGDREILELLSTEGALALHRATLLAQAVHS